MSLHGFVCICGPWDKSMIWMRNTTSNAIYLCCKGSTASNLTCKLSVECKAHNNWNQIPILQAKADYDNLCVQQAASLVICNSRPDPNYTCSHMTTLSTISKGRTKKGSHNEPAPTSAPSTGCPDLLSCGWTSIELIFGFASVTNSVGNRSHT